MRGVLRESALDLHGNIVRSVLSVVSLVLAVLAIIAINIAGQISRQVVVANSEQKYGRHVTVAADLSIATLAAAGLRSYVGRAETFLIDRGSAYALTCSTGTVRATGQIQGAPASLTLVAGYLNSIRRIPVLSGHWFDTDRYPGGLVVNKAAARSLGGIGTLLAIQTTHDERPYDQRVVGIVADGDSDPNVYASLTQAVLFRPVTLTGQTLTIDVHSESLGQDALISQVSSYAQALGIDPTSLDTREVDQVGQVATDVTTLQRSFLLVAAVALLVAIVGLVNIGLATVSQRARELTVRRAIGATRARVVVLVMMGCAATGFAAAFCAVVMSLLAVWGVLPHVLNRTLELTPPAFPWTAAFWGLALALAGSLLSGIVPAMRTTRLDLAAALRD